jgi:hypothetical protein
MLNKAEILDSLGYPKSSIGYLMAEQFLNCPYAQAIDVQLLKAVRAEWVRLDTEMRALDARSKENGMAHSKKIAYMEKMSKISEKMNSLSAIQRGIVNEVVLNLRIAVETAYHEPQRLMTAAAPADLDHLKIIVKKFHARKIDDATEVGFKKNVTVLIDAQKGILGKERGGIVSVLKHILGGLLTGLGVGLPLLSKTFRNQFFGTKSEAAVSRSRKAVEDAEVEVDIGAVVLAPQMRPEVVLPKLREQIREASNAMKTIHVLLTRQAAKNDHIRSLVISVNDLNIPRTEVSDHPPADFLPNRLRDFGDALKEADRLFASISGFDSAEVNAAREQLQQLLSYKSKVIEQLPIAHPAPRM